MGIEELLVFAGVYFAVEAAKFLGLKSDAYPALAIVIGAAVAVGIAATGESWTVSDLQAAAERGAFLGLSTVGANQLLRRLPARSNAAEEREGSADLSPLQEEVVRQRVMARLDR